MSTEPIKIPIMALREVVMFPNGVFPLFVGRDFTIRSIMRSIRHHDRRIFMIAQRDPEVETISSRSEIYDVGTVSEILQAMELPHHDGLKVLFKGIYRGRLIEEGVSDPRHKNRKVTSLAIAYPFTESCTPGKDSKALMRSVLALCREQKENNPFFRDVVEQFTNTIDEYAVSRSGYLADLVTQFLKVDYREKQQILETSDGVERLRKVQWIMNSDR